MGLLDKMYEDSKYAAKERQKKNEALAKQQKKDKEELERKKKAAKEKAERERKKKKKPPTWEEKIAQSALAIVIVPFVVIFSIYLSSSYLSIILKSTKGSKFLKEYFPDGEGVPYGKGEQGAGIKCKDIKKYLPPREASGGDEPPPQAGGGKSKVRTRVQKGGFNKDLNEAKELLDSTKYGPPYSWIENENFLMNGMGNYFKTYWQGIRGGTKMILENTKEFLYKEYTEPTNIGEQAIDYLKFTFALPLIASITTLLQNVGSIGLLFWAAFNNQTLLIVPLFILGLLLVFMGWFSILPYFWPWGLLALYSLFFVLRLTNDKKSFFKTYGRRYKWMWCFTIALGWLITVGAIWDWKKEAMIFIAMICALFLLGMFGITNLV